MLKCSPSCPTISTNRQSLDINSNCDSLLIRSFESQLAKLFGGILAEKITESKLEFSESQLAELFGAW